MRGPLLLPCCFCRCPFCREYAALYLEKKPQEDVLKKLKALHEALATLVEQTQADLALVLKKSGSDFVWDPSAADSVVSTPSLSAAPLNAKDATEAHPKAVHAALKTFASAAGAWSSKASAVLAAGLKAPDFDAADKTVNLADLFWSGSAAGLKDATAALLKAIAPLPDLFEKTAKNWDEAARVIRDGLKGATKSNTVLDEAVARAAAVRADAKVLLKLGTRLCHPFGACAEPKAMASPEAALASAIEEMNGWSAYLQIRRYDMPAMKWSCEKTGMDAFSANNEGTVAEAFARNMKAIVGPAEAGKPLPFADQVAAFASRSADKEAEFQAAAKAAKGMAAGKKAFAADVAGGKNMLKLE